jgi:pantoate--beta-alanine ligase
MQVIEHSAAMAEWTAGARRAGARIGFVPTMGALHRGHLALIDAARSGQDMVAASIFVNPLQFNDPADLANYPVRTAEDEAMLRAAGCHVLFRPTRNGLFAGFTPKAYDLGGLDAYWEGPQRPGHFQGVVNVVERLFNAVRPDAAYFGEKDRQQLAIIRHVAEQLRWPVAIVPCPTLRESDGLAMSSRNLRLSAEDRSRATALHQALQAVASIAFTHPVGSGLAAGRAVIERTPGLTLEYLGIAHPDTLAPLSEWGTNKEAVALIAAQAGPVRLIDNLTLRKA